MRILWLCNLTPGPVQQALTGQPGSGLWVDHVLSDLIRQPDTSVYILCRGARDAQGALGEEIAYQVFSEPVMHRYKQDLEALFSGVLDAFRPDVVHIWGTEYGHTLAMLRAIVGHGLLDRTAVSIQGLCGIYARHFSEGLPPRAAFGFTPRDLLRLDNVFFQRRRFSQRGRMEAQALSLTRHVIGRTSWDRACTRALAPSAQYHFCNETLRSEFYTDSWQYAACARHSIFASSAASPVKGFHYLLEALPTVLSAYPDAQVLVPGPDLFHPAGKSRLLEQTYHYYLRTFAEKHDLTDKVRFLGHLSPEEMKRQYLSANVFALPSTIENSPNSLGEAMLLGVPCVAADVGGVADMLEDRREGLVYQSTAPYMLAQKILDIFDLAEQAEALGQAARAHARRTHDPEGNLNQLLSIYQELCREEAHG